MQRLIEGVHKFRTERVRQLPEALPQAVAGGPESAHAVHHLLGFARAGGTHHAQPAGRFVRRQKRRQHRPARQRHAATPIPPPPPLSSPWNNLRVSDIVICGHSQCGAISALLDETPVSDSQPHLRDWLQLAAPVLGNAEKRLRASHRNHRARKRRRRGKCLVRPRQSAQLFLRAGTADGRLAAIARLVFQNRHGGTVRLRPGDAAVLAAGE